MIRYEATCSVPILKTGRLPSAVPDTIDERHVFHKVVPTPDKAYLSVLKDGFMTGARTGVKASGVFMIHFFVSFL